uniref:Endonuclease/exonuclease/phosphatase domain-containing protein n=1 Tax=Lotharella oceanica TaxID=641309 RepID=A0A7S2TI34_9EUKA
MSMDWIDSRRRSNTMIYATLADRVTGVQFGVATYHMPCAFFAPRVMVLHSAMAATRTAQLSEGLPFVLTGDFNLKPGDETYRLLTEGVIPPDPKATFTPALPENSKIKPFWTEIPKKLKSAYKEVQGEEPEFTNYAVTRGSAPFIETLDYIFHSPEIEALEVRPLPPKAQAVGPYPTESEPSDHAMIAATLRIPASTFTMRDA